MESPYKIVLVPVEVCVGHYCWGHGKLCPQFSNEGGHPVCGLNLGDLKYDKETHVPKPSKCEELKNA